VGARRRATCARAPDGRGGRRRQTDGRRTARRGRRRKYRTRKAIELFDGARRRANAAGG